MTLSNITLDYSETVIGLLITANFINIKYIALIDNTIIVMAKLMNIKISDLNLFFLRFELLWRKRLGIFFHVIF
jgi:hypothetical protein